MMLAVRRTPWLLLALLGGALAASPGAAQEPVEEMPGFVDFGRFGSFDLDDLQVEINLGGSLLRLLSGALEGEDDEFSQLLRSLKLIKVNVFELPAEDRERSRSLRSAVDDLRAQGWESVVRIRQDDEIHVLIRSDDELILGLLATWSGGDGSLGMLNIVGDFDPAQIARLARQLNIGALEEIDLGGLEKPERKP